MGSLVGSTALVTGASRGIGLAIAQAFAEQGCEVMVTARSAGDLAAAAGVIGKAGGRVHRLAGDITAERFRGRLFAAVRQRLGRLDILVNNAGMAPFGPVEELPPARLQACLELNVVAAYACMQHAIRLMRESGGRGKIINIGSVRSHWTEAGDAGAYNASKVALRAITESVARQLHGSGLEIAVGMVCPGVVDTTLTNPAGEPRPDWLEPATVARAVLHAVTAPPGVNIFDTVLFSVSQRPW